MSISSHSVHQPHQTASNLSYQSGRQHFDRRNNQQVDGTNPGDNERCSLLERVRGLQADNRKAHIDLELCKSTLILREEELRLAQQAIKSNKNHSLRSQGIIQKLQEEFAMYQGESVDLQLTEQIINQNDFLRSLQQECQQLQLSIKSLKQIEKVSYEEKMETEQKVQMLQQEITILQGSIQFMESKLAQAIDSTPVQRSQAKQEKKLACLRTVSLYVKAQQKPDSYSQLIQVKPDKDCEYQKTLNFEGLCQESEAREDIQNFIKAANECDILQNIVQQNLCLIQTYIQVERKLIVQKGLIEDTKAAEKEAKNLKFELQKILSMNRRFGYNQMTVKQNLSLINQVHSEFLSLKDRTMSMLLYQGDRMQQISSRAVHQEMEMIVIVESELSENSNSVQLIEDSSERFTRQVQEMPETSAIRQEEQLWNQSSQGTVNFSTLEDKSLERQLQASLQ